MVSAKHALYAAAIAVSVLARPRVSHAQSSEAPDASRTPERPEPRVHHAPIAVAESDAPLLVRADIEHPELVRRAILVYRTARKPDLSEAVFQRGSLGPYVAVVPAEEVTNPWLTYTIELERTDGTRVAAFATRTTMQLVEIPELLSDMQERALAERLHFRRSVLTASTEYVRFGPRDSDSGRVKDEYYRVEAGYTYRPLQTVAEFGLRGGIVRTTDSQLRGLNYGSPSVRFRLSDAFQLEGEFLTSVTDKGFALGSGATLLVGDPYGSKLGLGFETIEDYGSRVFSRLDIAANQKLLVSTIVEATNMPYGDRFGVRLLADLRYEIGGGFAAGVVGGYQARVATSGGPSVGTTLQYSF